MVRRRFSLKGGLRVAQSRSCGKLPLPFGLDCVIGCNPNVASPLVSQVTSDLNDSYRVRIRSGEFEVEVQGPDQGFVDAKITELLGWFDSDGRGDEPQGPASYSAEPSVAGKMTSLLEHVRKVSPRGGLEYALAVGYYLENAEGMAGGFRRRDLAAGFKKIRYNHTNPGVPISSGRKQGLLVDGSEPERVRLSKSASDWIAARLSGE